MRQINQVFECAGFLSATPKDQDYCRCSGTVVEVGRFVDMCSIDFNINRLLMLKNLSLEAIWGSQTSHIMQALPIPERCDIQFGNIISHYSRFQVAEGSAALNGLVTWATRRSAKSP
jgi:threonine dehydrogenase-like Zn-dependent dehydrogenase